MLILVPSVAVPGALIVWKLSSIGPAVLVLAGALILGTIGNLWASVRTLTGDAPLPEGLEIMGEERNRSSALLERKAALLRALKDLEQERALGKIDAADFEGLSARYREQVKEVLRQIDQEMDPLVERAEALAREHLERRGLIDATDADGATASTTQAGGGGADAHS